MRNWTHDDVAALRAALRVACSWDEVSSAVGRSVSSCRGAAQARGWSLDSARPRGVDYADQVMALNRRGFSDRAISRQLGVSVGLVNRQRREAGLPVRRESFRALMRRRYERQMAANGMGSLVEARWERDSLAAVQRGWPADCRPLEVAFLEYLDRHGWGTVGGFAAWLGRSVHSATRFRSGRYMPTELARKGYIAVREGMSRGAYELVIGRRHKAGLSGRQVDQLEGVR